MKYSHRVWIYAPVAVLVMIAIAYGAYWFVARDRITEWLDANNGRQILPGVTFAFAEREVGGFPFRVDVVLKGVTVSQMTREGENAWRAEQFAVHAMPYNFSHFIFEAAGLQSFARPPERPGGPSRVLYVTPGVAHASAMLDGKRLTRVDIDFVNVAIRDATMGAPPGRTARLGRVQLHLRAEPDRSIAIAFRLDNALIGAGYQPPLGPDLQLFMVQGALTEAQKFEGLQHGVAGVFNAVENWRLAKGHLAVSNFQFRWGDVETVATGRMRFDDRHRLRGRIDAAVKGHAALVAAAQRMGHIDELEGSIANAALYAMSRLAADRYGRLPVSFRFEDGKFKVGPITAMRLDPMY
jgi:hypothetical protein